VRVFIIAVLALSIFVCEKSWSWGETGHRIVGQIAESRLTPSARAKIHAILGDESLAEASTWGDEVRSDRKFAKYDPWHYVEIPDGLNYGNSPKNPEGDVIVGIQTTIAVLQGKSNVFKPDDALRYLVHFMGDLHQPLHVGNGKDQGGNMCTVKFAGRNTSLHVVWDTHLIGARELSYTEFSNFLNRNDLVTTAKIRKWTAGNVVDWAQETMKIRNSVYPPNNDPRFTQDELGVDFNTAGEPNYCKKSDDESIPTAKIPMIGFGYEYKFKKVLDEHLTKAGVRLSFILNQLF